ncbi:hypothetical protein N7456_012379 [Penicillium angulare]|uniref:Uncharacterized protein n=1 Tax=Penicillium angulare TaxID=116970 RepID=A0A9W9EVK3_9EURO|nr:hypothetical protein N7456_012379 [Penicillium angulare]
MDPMDICTLKRRKSSSSETFDDPESKRLKAPNQHLKPQPEPESNPVKNLVNQAITAFKPFPNMLNQKGIINDPGVWLCIYRLAYGTINDPLHWSTPQEHFMHDGDAFQKFKIEYIRVAFEVWEKHEILGEYRSEEKFAIMIEVVKLWFEFRWPGNTSKEFSRNLTNMMNVYEARVFIEDEDMLDSDMNEDEDQMEMCD